MHKSKGIMRPLLICLGAIWVLCGLPCLAAPVSLTASHLGCEIHLDGTLNPIPSIIDRSETPEKKILSYWIKKQKNAVFLLTQIGVKLKNPQFNQKTVQKELEHYAHQDELLREILLQTQSPSSLASKIGDFLPKDYDFEADRRVLATLLYGLSFSQQGRELIDRTWPILTQALATNFHFSVLDDDEQTPLGLCTILDKTTDPDLKNDLLTVAINRSMSLGEAIVILAHELTHSYDFLINEISKNYRGKDKTVLIEHRAVYMEKTVASELVQQWPSYRSWYDHHPRSIARSAVRLTRSGFIDHLKRAYKVDESTSAAYFNTHEWNAFRFPLYK